MDANQTPEQAAAGMVRVVSDRGPAHVELTRPGAPPVRLQAHQNPGLADVEAAEVRAFLADVIRSARGGKK